MKTEFLQGLGLNDDQIKSVMAENGKDITDLKTRVATLEDDIKIKEGVIQEKNTKITEFEKVDIESIKTQAKEEGKAEGLKESQDFQRNSSLSKILKDKYKAKDPEDIVSKLDIEKIKFNDKYEITEGLEEQVTSLIENKGYLFDTDSNGNTKPHFGSSTQGELDQTTDLSDLESVMGINNK